MNYRIEGDTLPVVIMNLEAGESIITEGGGMSWMSPNMLMETTTNGGIGKVLGRAFSGDTLFQNIYTAQGGPGAVSYTHLDVYKRQVQDSYMQVLTHYTN